MRIVFLAVALLSVALTGCATLEVSVGILDKQRLPLDKKVESNTWIEAARYSSEVEHSYYARLKRLAVDETRSIIDELLKPLSAEEKAKGGIALATSADQRAQIDAQILKSATDQLDKARAAGEAGLEFYRRALVLEGPNRGAEMGLAHEKLRLNRQLVRQFIDTLDADLKTYIDQYEREGRDSDRAVRAARALLAKPAADDVARDIDATASRLSASLFGGMTLFDDPLASWVVGSPPDAWSSKFNHTFGAGYLGNVDIAVKLETEGAFTLKGVRLDAAKTTAATFAVIRQAVNVFAGGIPLPSAATGTTATMTAPAPDSSSTVSSASSPPVPDVSRSLLAGVQAMRESERQQREQAQFAISAIFDAVLRNKADLQSSVDTTRASAIADVTMVYNAHKKMLGGATQGEGT